jgi:hypothetical protein
MFEWLISKQRYRIKYWWFIPNYKNYLPFAPNLDRHFNVPIIILTAFSLSKSWCNIKRRTQSLSLFNLSTSLGCAWISKIKLYNATFHFTWFRGNLVRKIRFFPGLFDEPQEYLLH